MCCDLLEKSYFCSIANNSKLKEVTSYAVVICLKNRTFAVSQTTIRPSLFVRLCCDLLEKSYFCSIANNQKSIKERFTRLWFAWKIVLLQYRKQHTYQWLVPKLGCDLLEKSYFCSIANNTISARNLLLAVVICLKNRTFAVSQTTCCQIFLLHLMLWFAWKIVLLQYRKQHI